MVNINDVYSVSSGEVTEEDVIQHSRLEHLYNHDFGGGRFFQVVFSDTQETRVRLAPRTLMQIVYLPNKDDIEGIKLVKLVDNQSKQAIQFSKFNLEQLRTFLSFIDSLSLKSITERKIKLSDGSLDELDSETKKKIQTLLSAEEGAELVATMLKDGLITGQDLVNTGYRKCQLEKFNELLHCDDLQPYKYEIGKPKCQDETAWQYFFNTNQWIFGYGLDYRFQGILQKEFHASDTNAAGKDGVIGDFLLGDKKFTTFVELKLPSTAMYGTSKNRSGAWRLSTELIDACSQILEQKAAGELKLESKKLFDSSGEEITQRAHDSRTILLIGSWDQLSETGSSEEKMIKQKTFELFRRDSRNIDIITYDELYDRARFIVTNDAPATPPG